MDWMATCSRSFAFSSFYQCMTVISLTANEIHVELVLGRLKMMTNKDNTMGIYQKDEVGKCLQTLLMSDGRLGVYWPLISFLLKFALNKVLGKSVCQMHERS